MPPFNGSFDANQFKPNQGGDIIPPGMHDFVVSNTTVDALNGDKGGAFIVEFSTPAGFAKRWYNLWFQNPADPVKAAKTVEIAHGQLSALCHAVGIFQIDFKNEGAALRGARGKALFGYQKGEEPSAEKPNGGFTEIKKIYDAAGNEPGKAPAQPQAQQAQPQGGNQPMVQQAGGGWGQGAAQPTHTQQPPQGQQNGQAWQPGQNGATDKAPPWGARQ